jgi:hypothetical protein
MSQQQYTTVRLSDWTAFRDFVGQLTENWAFRGQANASWVLNNAIERTAFIRYHTSMEADFVAEFQRGARNYLTSDETPRNLLEWLALMQHHGAPTRLLDLTKSPFIAAYFAFEHCSSEAGHYVGIWCINVRYLKERSVEMLAPLFGDAETPGTKLINEELFEKLFHQNDQHLVFPIEPFSMNRRYSLQQSLFVSTGVSYVPFMDQLQFLGNDIARAVIRVEIPGSCRKQALRDLQQMNLHRASLFPDLDGYALSLRLRYEQLRTPEEAERLLRAREGDRNFPFLP